MSFLPFSVQAESGSRATKRDEEESKRIFFDFFLFCVCLSAWLKIVGEAKSAIALCSEMELALWVLHV